MGEMIGHIAHQWRQPLNALSLLLQNIVMHYEMDNLSDEFMKRIIEKGNRLTQQMSQTIDEFRSFFKPSKEKEKFLLHEAYASAKDILEATLLNHSIKLEEHIDLSIKTSSYKNQLSHVILNILNNAKDILVEKNIEHKLIVVKMYQEQNIYKIEIHDNAGGVPIDIIDYIFDPYFSTKGEAKGTGLGLYMSKLIIESNLHGKLEVLNSEDGAKFTISFPQ